MMELSSTIFNPEKESSSSTNAPDHFQSLTLQADQDKQCSTGQENTQPSAANGTSHLDQSKNNESADQKNDSSTLSTAFTISFEDDTSNTGKKLGIKDSIRKFAPPKPNTIEKPRQSKSDKDNQETCMMSIESAPVMGSSSTPRNQTYRKSSSRSSSGRRSNSSRHSNISESAAYLIEKMLSCKDKEATDDQIDYSEPLDSGDKRRDTIIKVKGSAISGAQQDSDVTKDIANLDVDFNEAGSDNGTYVVGADPESEGLIAARKNIDKLFGIVKAAEASVLAESRASGRGLQSKGVSRAQESGGLSKERQERFSRLARRTPSSVSRSSSSSRQDQPQDQRVSRQDCRSAANGPRQSHHSRRSSCDRQETRDQQRAGTRHRRSISQSSRHSSPRELSNGDTRSSHSSLHERDSAAANSNQENLTSQANNPSMKFNRAFALRRARLGLGEPVRSGQQQQPNSAAGQEQVDTVASLSSTQRRHQMNTSRSNQSAVGPASASFCREDGGRFSLRVKANPVPSRLNSMHQHNQNSPTNRSPQHAALIETYVNKMAGAKGAVNPLNQVQEQASIGGQRSRFNNVTSSTVPYQSGDELEPVSPSRHKHHSAAVVRTLAQQPRRPNDIPEQDADYSISQQRLNHSLAAQASTYESLGAVEYLGMGNRSMGQVQGRNMAGNPAGPSMQLGALDSLVISAISSLSLKIRHSVCDLLVAQAKRLPTDNGTRAVVEEILPHLTANPAGQSRLAPSIEEIDGSLCVDLAKTLKNLKKIEQMVDVIDSISRQMPPSPIDTSNIRHHHGVDTAERGASSASSDPNSANDLSPA